MSELGFSIGGISAHVGYEKPFDRKAEVGQLSIEITELSEVLLMMTTPAWKRVCAWAQDRVAGYEQDVIALSRDQDKNEKQIAVLMGARDMLDGFMQSINNRVSALPHKQQELETLGAAVAPSPPG